MNPDRYQRIQEIFLAALEQEESQRSAFLQRVCQGDLELLREVESLLEQDRNPTQFMNPKKWTLPSLPPRLPEKIANYRILKLLGEGGMGVVYLAEQENPRRIVAVKVLKEGIFSPERVRRFAHEVQLLGRLKHPGIAQIFEAGSFGVGVESKQYFAMEYVEGKSLSEFVRARPLTAPEKLLLLQKICEGVEHAHLKGVVHRDLKPANILVDSKGQPKILDFGLARATDWDWQQASVQTKAGQLLGTLPYMSPEQLEGENDRVDERSDVYALGVIGYELLAGRLPHELGNKPMIQVAQEVQVNEPLALGSVDRHFRGDIETLIAKALEKEPERRYLSASAFAADIARCLRHEPILARPATTIYQLKKFARRNRALVGGVLGVMVALICGVAGTLWQAVRATEGMRQAEESKLRAQREAGTSRAVKEFLFQMIAQSNPERTDGQDLKVVDAIDRQRGRISAVFAGQPDVEAEVRKLIGELYYNLGFYKEAEEQLRSSWQYYESVNRLDSSFPLGLIGLALFSRGKLTEAEQFFRQAIDARCQSFGEASEEVLMYRLYLPEILEETGKLNEARQEAKRVWDAMRIAWGGEDSRTLRAQRIFGRILAAHDELDQAETLLREALKISERQFPEWNLDSIRVRKALAGLLHKKGNLTEAEELLQSVVGLDASRLSESHPDRIGSVSSLVMVLIDREMLQEAESLARKNLILARKLIERGHRESFPVHLNALAMVLQSQGRGEEAEPLWREARQVALEIYGPRHSYALAVSNNLGALLCSLGKYQEALPLLEENLSAQRDVFGSQSTQAIDAGNNLGAVLLFLRRFDEARPHFEKALSVRMKVLGEQNPETINSMSNLGKLLKYQKDFSESERHLKNALEGNERLFGKDHSRAARSRDDLASLYSAWEKAKESSGELSESNERD